MTETVHDLGAKVAQRCGVESNDVYEIVLRPGMIIVKKFCRGSNGRFVLAPDKRSLRRTIKVITVLP